MKRILLLVLVASLLIPMFAAGESIPETQDAAEVEVVEYDEPIIEEEPVEEVNSEIEEQAEAEIPAEAEYVSDEEPAATPAPEQVPVSDNGSDTIADVTIAPAETDEAEIAEEVVPEEKAATYVLYGKVQNKAFADTEIVNNKVTVPFQYKYKIRVDGASKTQKVTFKSSSKTNATVATDGVVTFKKQKAVKITVTVTENGKSVFKQTVTVTPVTDPTAVAPAISGKQPTTASLDGKTLYITVGTKVQLKAVYTPDFTTSTVTWKSSKKTIATVSNKGLVKAVKKGTTKLTLTTANKKKCTVTVKVLDKKEAVAVTIKGKTAFDVSAAGKKLTYKLSPAKATSTVTWSSSNKKIATISAKGVLTFKKVGTVTITAKASTGAKASVTLTITDKTLPTSITLNKTGTVKIYTNEKLTLKATVLPKTATGTITWTSSNKSVATVADGVVTPVAEGVTTITAKTRNSLTATVTVQVIATSEPTVEPSETDSFTYAEIDSTTCSITGYTGTETSLVLPTTATDGKKVVTIAAEAFKNNTSIKSVVIPDGIVSINGDAFSGCTALASVTFPSTMSSICDNAFYGCKSLTSVTIPSGVTTIQDNCFAECTKLAAVSLSNNVTTIGYRAFYNCSSLVEMTTY